MIGKDYEFVFEDQIEFISTEVLKNTLKQKGESVINNKGGVDEDEDDEEEEGDGNMSVSMGKRDSNSSINIVKAKKETAHQKILAGSHYHYYYSSVSPLLVLLSSLVSSFPLIVLLS